LFADGTINGEAQRTIGYVLGDSMSNWDVIIKPARGLARAAIAGVALLAAGGAAFADPVSPAGWTAGIALGAPLPEGVYFINTATYFERSPKSGTGAPTIDAGVNIPVVAWATPLTILGGRVEVLGIVPELAVGVNPNAGVGSSSWRDFYNPAGLVGVAWDLGGGFGFANYIGAFAPVNTALGNTLNLGGNYWTFLELATLAYNRDTWSATANFTYSSSGNDRSTGIHIQPDTAQIDFTITKHFNKWEVGLVGYGSTDLGDPWPLRTAGGLYGRKQSQFALGGLVGYNFGPVITQFYLTRDVAESNYSGYDTRFWSRVIVPLWNPDAPAKKPLIVK
jgi:Putative MetA-pathway of phenol degradation